MENRVNILSFLTPKEELAFIYEDNNIEELLEQMEKRRYAAIPVLKRSGEYVGTITEGDLLWAVKNSFQMNLRNALHVQVSALPRHADNTAVTISTDVEILFTKSQEQNFVPVVDDRGIFIGIVTRRNVIQYYRSSFTYNLLGQSEEKIEEKTKVESDSIL